MKRIIERGPSGANEDDKNAMAVKVVGKQMGKQHTFLMECYSVPRNVPNLTGCMMKTMRVTRT